MKALKVKSVLFSLLTMLVVVVFMTSCEQELIVEEKIEGLNQSELEEVISPPLTPEELNAVWSELEQDEENIVERNSNCACKRVYATRRSSTSSYVYCQRWQDSSSMAVEYKVGSSTKYRKRYYETFTGLTPGQNYNYRARLWCNNGQEFTSSYYCFIQNSYYPSPHVY